MTLLDDPFLKAPPLKDREAAEHAILDAGDPAFRRFAETHRWNSLFTAPPWLDVLAATYGFRIEVSARLEGGRITAALPFCRIEDPRGRRIASLPFSDYCDPLVTEPRHWWPLIAPLIEADCPLRLRLLHNPLPLADTRLAPTASAFWHAVDLTRPEEAIWASLEGTARRNVRKAERAGVEVRIGHDLEDVRLFHRMHGHLRKTKYRMLAQPGAFFEAIHEHFTPSGDVAVLTAWHDGQPLAGILLITWRDTLYYKFNASFDTGLRPNDLLLWEALRHGRAQRLRRLDFGISDGDQPGLLRYKRKFATEEKPIHLLARQPTPATSPAAAETGTLLGCMTRLLTDPAIPDSITREAGDAFYRYFA